MYTYICFQIQMRKYRLERQNFKSFRSKKKNELVFNKNFVVFEDSKEFLHFITNGPSTSDSILEWVLQIFHTLDNQTSLVHEEAIYDALFNRTSELIHSDDDYRIKAVSMAILTLLTTNMGRLIRAVFANHDLVIIRSIYMTEFHVEVAALNFFQKSFAIFAERRYQSLLINWWRFRFFFQSAIQCLIEIVCRKNKTPISSENTIINMNNNTTTVDQEHSCKERLDTAALSILFELSLEVPDILFAFGDTQWFLQAIRSSFLSNENSPADGCLIQILNSWLDSPLLRERLELHLILQQLFGTFFDACFIQGLQSETKTIDIEIGVCKRFLLNLANNWSGLLAEFAIGEQNILHQSSVFNLFEHLGKNNFLTPNIEKIQGTFVDFICDVLQLPYSNSIFKPDDWNEALQRYKQSIMPDPFDSSLRENFVIAEINFMNFLQFDETDLLMIYRSIIIYGLLNAGIMEALTRIIINQNPDNSVSVKATLLLADICKLSKNLPQSLRIKTLSTKKLVQQTVKAFQARSLKEISQTKEQISYEGFFSTNDSIFDNPDDKKVDWLTLLNDNGRHSLLLIDRLDQLDAINNKPIKFTELNLVNNFLVIDTENRRKRGNSLLSRHSSASGDPNNTIEDNAMYEENFQEMNSELNILLEKAFASSMQFHNQNNDIQNQMNLISITGGVGVGVPIIPLQSKQIQTAGCELIKPIWEIIWKILRKLDDKLAQTSQQKSSNSGKIIDKCVTMFNQLTQYFLPSNRRLITTEPDPLTIHTGQYMFQLLCDFTTSATLIGPDNAQWATDLLSSFLYDFALHLQPDALDPVFTSKNLLCSSASNYFTMLRVLSSYQIGHKLIEQTSLGQILIDRISDEKTPIELIKLIIASMDYDSAFTMNNNYRCTFARNLLESVLLSHKDVAIRKWCLYFLNSFFTLNFNGFIQNFDWIWTIQLVFRQLTDLSVKIVRVAVNLLLKWLPYCPTEHWNHMRELLERTRLEIYGDSGVLLETFLYGNLDDSNTKHHRNRANNAIRKWKTVFCDKYVDIVEQMMNDALVQNNGTSAGFFYHERSMDGDFARSTNQRSFKGMTKVLCPVHLYGQLASSNFGRHLLTEHGVLEELESKLTNIGEKNVKSVKGALFALAHILANLPNDRNLYGQQIRYYTSLLESCVHQSTDGLPILSIRGCAIFSVNIAARGNHLVSSILSESGWEFGESHASDFDNFDSVNILKNTASDLHHSIEDSQFDFRTPCSSISRSRKCSMEKNLSDQNDLHHDTHLQKRRHYFSESVENNRKLSRSSSTMEMNLQPIKTQISSNLCRMDNEAFGSGICSPKYQRIQPNTKGLQLLSEETIGSLSSYRKFLSKMDEVCNEDLKMPNKNNRKEYDNVTFHDKCSVMLPKDIQKLFGNIFAEKKAAIISNPDRFCQPNIDKHTKWLCLHCTRMMRTTTELDMNKDELGDPKRAIILENISKMVGNLSNAEAAIKLLSMYEDDPFIFENPCIFSDAIRITLDSKTIGFEGRKLLYQLFWNAI